LRKSLTPGTTQPNKVVLKTVEKYLDNPKNAAMSLDNVPVRTDSVSHQTTELCVVGRGVARLTMTELAAIRKESLPNLPVRLSPQLLRHSDEQTLAVLAALSDAVKSMDASVTDFTNWAVISSSQNLGRSAFAGVIDKYRTEGPWGVSVQVIPHCTAHSVAGSVSLALASHGPCIGAGGCVDGQTDALLCASSVLKQTDWDGAWIVFSTWLPELSSNSAGNEIANSICTASVLAVTRQSCGGMGRIRFAVRSSLHTPAISEIEKPSSHVPLLDFVCGDAEYWSSPVESALRIEIELNHEKATEASNPVVSRRMPFSALSSFSPRPFVGARRA
jgi:hypothetical protein